MQRVIGLLLIVVLTLLAALASSFQDALWAGYRDYASPYLAGLPGGAARPAISPRTVVVVARSLRLNASRQMAALNELRQRGADVILSLEPPTYRLPAWLTLLSGATVAAHGTTSNDPARAADVDSLFQQMQTSGQNTAVVGSAQFVEVFGAHAGQVEQVDGLDMNERDDNALAATLEVLRDTRSPAQLVVMELTALEESARAGAGAYGVAVVATDRRIRALLEAVDLAANTLVVVSDRGATADGSDGGGESEVARAPWVMAGVGVQIGIQAIVAASDVMPTLAALTGSPMPVHNQGQLALSVLSMTADAPVSATGVLTESEPAAAALTPVGELLWASAAQLALFYENWSEVVGQPRFAAEQLRQLERRIKSGDTRAYQVFAINLSALARTAIAGRLGVERAQRLPILIGAAMVVVASIGLLVGARMWQPFAGALLYLALWLVVFFVIRQRSDSLSMFADGMPGAFLEQVGQDASALLIFLSIVVALMTSGCEDGLQAVSVVVATLTFVAVIQLAQVAWFYWQWGIVYTWWLPDSSSLVAAMVALTHLGAQSIPIAPGLPSLPLPLVSAVLALVLYSFVRRRRRRDRFTHIHM